MSKDFHTDLDRLEFRPFTRRNEASVIELVRLSLYGENFPDLAGYWRWKHYENPFGESFGLEAWAGGQLAAVRVFMHWQLCGGGQLLRAGRAVDMAVHPEWRRRGLFERMTLALLDPMASEGLVLTFNTPNAMSLSGYHKMGWAHPGRLPLRVRVFRPLRTLSVMAKWCARRPAAHAALSADVTEDVNNVAVLRLLQDSAVRRLVLEAGAAQLTCASPHAATSRLRTALSPEYLEWHYGTNRWYQYAAAYESRGAEAALVIGRVRPRRGLVEVLVTEVVNSGGRRGQALAARAAARLAHDTRADYLVVSALGEALDSRRGYFPVGRRGADVAVRVLDTALSVDPTTWAGWAAGIGDFELF